LVKLNLAPERELATTDWKSIASGQCSGDEIGEKAGQEEHVGEAPETGLPATKPA
jgi:hypothetical protein